MTTEEARREIVRRAGAKSGFLPVLFVGDGATHGPRLISSTRKQPRRGKERRVIVSVRWLIREAPELWAAFCAARILGTEQITITSRKETVR